MQAILHSIGRYLYISAVLWYLIGRPSINLCRWIGRKFSHIPRIIATLFQYQFVQISAGLTLGVLTVMFLTSL